MFKNYDHLLSRGLVDQKAPCPSWTVWLLLTQIEMNMNSYWTTRTCFSSEIIWLAGIWNYLWMFSKWSYLRTQFLIGLFCSLSFCNNFCFFKYCSDLIHAHPSFSNSIITASVEVAMALFDLEQPKKSASQRSSMIHSACPHSPTWIFFTWFCKVWTVAQNT